MWDVDLCWKTSWRAHSPTVVSSSIWSGSDYPIFGMGWPGLIHWFAIIRSMLIRSQLFYGRVPTCVILKSRKFRWQNVPDKDWYSPPFLDSVRECSFGTSGETCSILLSVGFSRCFVGPSLFSNEISNKLNQRDANICIIKNDPIPVFGYWNSFFWQ